MDGVLGRVKLRTVGLGLLGGLTLLGMASAAQAQINPFKNYNGPVLTKADYAAGREAAIRLLGTTPPPVGASESWAGPTSGNHGTLTVERAYRQRNLDCRAVRSKVDYKAGRERSLLLNTCQIDGKWKLTS